MNRILINFIISLIIPSFNKFSKEKVMKINNIEKTKEHQSSIDQEQKQKQYQITDNKNETLVNISKKCSLTQGLASKYRKVVKNNQTIQQDEDENLEHTRRSMGKKESPKMEDNKNVENLSITKLQAQNILKLPQLKDKKLSIGSNSSKNQQEFNAKMNLSPTLKRYRKAYIKLNKNQNEHEQQSTKLEIRQYFSQLNLMIEKTAGFFQDRMKTHQNQLLKVMKNEIKRIQRECQKTIVKYNTVITNKKSGIQLLEARQETHLFKKHAMDLAKENAELKKQIKHLKRLNSQYEFKIQNDGRTMNDITKKLLSYKTKSKKYYQELNSIRQSIVKPYQLSKSTSAIEVPHINTPKSNSIKCCINICSPMSQKKYAEQSLRFKSQGRSRIGKSLQTTEMLRNLDKKVQSRYKAQKVVDDYFKSIKNDNNKCASISLHQNKKNQEQHIDSYKDENRNKIVKFLQEARPSIKSLLRQKKKKAHKLSSKSKIYTQNDYEGQIKNIKSRVVLSSFEQKKWQQSMKQRKYNKNFQFNQNQNSSRQIDSNTAHHSECLEN